MRRLRQCGPRPERGAAAVEFAVILPVVVALALGIFEFGRGYFTKIELTGAVREGARVLALGQDPGDAQARVTDASPGLDPGQFSFSGIQTCPSGTDGVGSITASYPYSYNVFFFSGSTNISVTGSMRCGV